MKSSFHRVRRPVAMILCLFSTAVLVACGGGEAQDEATQALETSTQTLQTATAESLSGRTQLAPQNQLPNQVVPTPMPAQMSSLSLAWIAPTQNSDGSSLTDLAGYRILVGTSSGNYSRIITIDNPATLNYTLSNLPRATYYVVVKAVDAANNESAPSAEMVKVL